MSRCIRIYELGAEPKPAETGPEEATQGRVDVDVLAAALNPVDLAVAHGKFYAGHPPLPYVPGVEAVGRLRRSVGGFDAGALVWVTGDGLGITRDGTLSESISVDPERLVEVPEGLDLVTAAAAGVAGLAGWIPTCDVARVGPADVVVVLGGTGTVGRVAVQAARLRGAKRVVAVGRDRDRLREVESLGADAGVNLDDSDFHEQLSSASGGNASVVIDALWGTPIEHAVKIAGKEARIVNLGQAAGASASLFSGDIRGRQLRIYGFSIFAVPIEELRTSFARMADAIRTGGVSLRVEAFSAEQVRAAWSAFTDHGKKVVLTFKNET